MLVRLKDIAQIQFGHYAQVSNQGTIPYLQAKHFDNELRLSDAIDTHIERDEKTDAHFLQNGDILFVSKGFRFFAVPYQFEMGMAVASSIFFVIKPDTSKILPSYLSIILNLPQNLAYFHQLSAGSSIPSIRKKELEDFSFELISLEKQAQIDKIQTLHQHDLRLSEKLIVEKKAQFNAIISKFIQ